MDALQDARDIMDVTTKNTGLDGEDLTWMFAQAQAYAAIAQAEQLKRIADMMEAYLDHYADSIVMSQLKTPT